MNNWIEIDDIRIIKPVDFPDVKGFCLKNPERMSSSGLFAF